MGDTSALSFFPLKHLRKTLRRRLNAPPHIHFADFYLLFCFFSAVVLLVSVVQLTHTDAPQFASRTQREVFCAVFSCCMFYIRTHIFLEIVFSWMFYFYAEFGDSSKRVLVGGGPARPEQARWQISLIRIVRVLSGLWEIGSQIWLRIRKKNSRKI